MKRNNIRTSNKNISPFDNTVLVYFYSFIILFANVECFYFMFSDSLFLKVISVLILGIFGSAILLYLAFKRMLTIRDFVWPAILGLLIFLSAILNLDIGRRYSYKHLLEFACLLFAFITLKGFGFKKILNAISYLLAGFAGLSLIVYILYYFKPSLFSFLPTLTNYIGHQYKFCGFCVIPIFYPSFPRNYMFFREPGVCIIYLFVALLWLSRKILIDRSNSNAVLSINIVSFFLLFITLLTTQSTTGLIGTIPILIFFFYCLYRNNKKVFAISIFAFLLAIIFFFIFARQMVNNFFNEAIWKLTKDNDSLSRRIIAPISNFFIMLENPMFGLGWTSTVQRLVDYGHYYGMRDSLTNMNTFTLTGAVNGLPYFVLMLVGSYVLSKKFFDNKPFLGFMSFLIIQLAFFGEDMTCSPFLYIIVLAGLLELNVSFRRPKCFQ